VAELLDAGSALVSSVNYAERGWPRVDLCGTKILAPG
jgi:hypothetical protein